MSRNGKPLDDLSDAEIRARAARQRAGRSASARPAPASPAAPSAKSLPAPGSCADGACSPERGLRVAPRSGEVINRGCCGGPDRGPVADDEGPSERDVERFSGVTVACPSCRTEMYDDAEVCWKCGHAILGPRKATPVWVIVTAVALIASVAGVVAWVL